MDASAIRYNQQKAVNDYYRMQYGPFLTNETINPLTESFYQEVKKTLGKYVGHETQLLEIGCGLGRVVFEASDSNIKKGIGTDISRAFITECNLIHKNSSQNTSYAVNDPNNSLSFQVVDAQKLPFNNQEFNCIVCLNLIDRVPQPKKVAEEIERVLSDGGILVISDPYDWQDKYTDLKDRVENIHQLFPSDEWETLEEIDHLPYRCYSHARKFVHYDDHLIVFKKIEK
jgi:SAM-dependent methyltransferase